MFSTGKQTLQLKLFNPAKHDCQFCSIEHSTILFTNQNLQAQVLLGLCKQQRRMKTLLIRIQPIASLLFQKVD